MARAASVTGSGPDECSLCCSKRQRQSRLARFDGDGYTVLRVPLFRRKKAPVTADDHAVLTHLPLSDDKFGTADEREAVRQLEERIEAAVATLGGEHDGNEFGGGEAMLYTYGPDADQLFDAIRECLHGFDVRPGAYAIKRYGRADDPDARAERVALT